METQTVYMLAICLWLRTRYGQGAKSTDQSKDEKTNTYYQHGKSGLAWNVRLHHMVVNEETG